MNTQVKSALRKKSHESETGENPLSIKELYLSSYAAFEHPDLCTACPRKCNVDRVTHLGVCNAGWLPKVARAALHFGEEPCICGTKGSGTVFFSGCALKCVYCQNHTISKEGFGKEISLAQLRQIFQNLLAQGAHNINLVTASHYVDAVAASFEDKPNCPIVYNCSGYESLSSLQKLKGKIDVYMPDYKYAFDILGKRYSSVKDYTLVCRAALDEMVAQVGKPRFDDQGLLIRGVLVRHLVLPGHLQNTRKVIDDLSARYGDSIVFSLMGQYTPMPLVKNMTPIHRPLMPIEYEEMCEYVSQSNLTLGYTQELSSSDTQYIPSFDLTGVPQE